MIDTPDKDPVRFLEKQIKKYDIINNLETMAIQTPNICKWTCNENIDKELSNEFWNNPTIMDKQKSSLIKFRTGTYMGQARKQTFFDRQKFPTITYPICNSYEPNTWLHVDNTFEYEGGLRRVTEDAFYATLKGQLKIKRYQLKKALQTGKAKPKHIRQKHWVICVGWYRRTIRWRRQSGWTTIVHRWRDRR